MNTSQGGKTENGLTLESIGFSELFFLDKYENESLSPKIWGSENLESSLTTIYA